MLAISFHATTDEVRDKLVPINKSGTEVLLGSIGRLSESLPNASHSNT
jgi:adenine C2-methylase RlmN of 23S rRNA A2503 and tRNA A37